jgi:hypothetical protein
MKHVMTINVLRSGLIVSVGLAGVVLGFSPEIETQAARRATPSHVLILDVAADCRTAVNVPVRAGVSFTSGKIFPAGTLPSGMASNDPTKPVNGVAPIGDWTSRAQFAFPIPPAVASSYSATPAFFGTQYFMLNGGQTALIVDGYASPPDFAALFSVIGGIGDFRGATGDAKGSGALGTNATGCPNFRVRFNIVPGSVPAASDD